MEMRISLLAFYVVCLYFVSFVSGTSISDVRKNPTSSFEKLHMEDLKELNDPHRHRDPYLDKGRNLSLSKEEKKKLKRVRKQERKERREDRRRNRKRIKDSSFTQSYEEGPLNSGKDSKVEGVPLQLSKILSVQVTPKPIQPYFPDMTWLANNLTTIWQLLQQMQKDIKQIRRTNGLKNQISPKKEKEEENLRISDKTKESTTEGCIPHWPIDSKSCFQDEGSTFECDGNGNCVCGQCECEQPYYGRHCQCNDHICERTAGIMCGGVGKGQCRCGQCVCRPGYVGKACECSLSTSNCHSGNGELCSGRGACVCNRCQCPDGYNGKWCQDSIYSASVCERLKPCVLCQAFGRKYPRCEECNIEVQHVDELELSQTTCVMINLGCIVKYAYSKDDPSDEITTVFVPEGMRCPP